MNPSIHLIKFKIILILNFKEFGYMNDLWHFDINMGAWAWITGETLSNVSTVGEPRGRASVGCWVTPPTVWIFGGQGPDGKSF